ncbi:MAG: hypothetical protein ACXWLS_13795 [Myxococcaceae bacterium]
MVTFVLLLLTGAAPTTDAVDRIRAWAGVNGGEPSGYDAMADCTGPHRAYRTRVAFRRSDGWARFVQWHGEEQSSDAVALGTASWVLDDAGKWAPGDADVLARVIGHQFLAMVLAPERIFRRLASSGKEAFEDQSVEWFTGTEIAGTPVELAIDAEGRPVVLRLHRGGKIGSLLVRWSGWQRIGSVKIPITVQIDQGKDIFRFRFRPPRLEPPSDAGWTPAGTAR